MCKTHLQIAFGCQHLADEAFLHPAAFTHESKIHFNQEPVHNLISLSIYILL